MSISTIAHRWSREQKATGAGEGACKSHCQEERSGADRDRAFQSTCTVCFTCPHNWIHAFKGIPTGLIYCSKYFFLWGGGEKRHKKAILENRETYNRSEKVKGNRAQSQMRWGRRTSKRWANTERPEKGGPERQKVKIKVSQPGVFQRRDNDQLCQCCWREGKEATGCMVSVDLAAGSWVTSILEKQEGWEPRLHCSSRTHVSIWISHFGAEAHSTAAKTQSVTLGVSARGGLEEVAGGGHGSQDTKEPRCLKGPMVDIKPPKMTEELEWKGRLWGRYRSLQGADVAISQYKAIRKREKWMSLKGQKLQRNPRRSGQQTYT